MNLLLISNSTNAGEAYLEYPKENIREFLLPHGTTEVLFIPYAGVTLSWDTYEQKVSDRFAEFGVAVRSIHHFDNPVQAVLDAQAIVVGGGNTFMLLKTMQDNGLIAPIRSKVSSGTPYIGWSAGSNMACPMLCTTNDMPIVEPQSFKSLGLIPFQINPHYLDGHPDGHAGETREQRIEEYIEANKGMFVAGLREGCMLLYKDSTLSLIGSRPLRIFKYGQQPYEVSSGDDLSFLM
ncbi:MAG: dipeptidase PepE [Rikenellaceae bacterium]